MHRLVLLFLIPLSAVAEDPRVTSGFNHFYNLEYEDALSDFNAVENAVPADPAIHNNIAQTLLYREMFRNGALESELVSGNNAFLRRAKMNPTAEVQKRFADEIYNAISLAQKKLDANPRDIAALYTVGVSYGLRSNYNFLVRKAWREALNDATQARKFEDQVIQIDPSNYDSRLIQGAHDYIVGSLPWAYRMMGTLVGFHGDKEGGLRTIEMVAHKGVSNRVDAEILLCALYRREGRPKSAIPLLDDLLKRYPRNFLLLFEKAQMYSALGNKREALGALAEVSDLKQGGAPGFIRVPWEKIYYERGNIQFWYNDLDQALSNLKKVTASPKDLDLNTGVLAYMRQGQIYDLQSHHDLARKAYEQAITFAPEAEAARESRRYMADPYRRSRT